MFHSCFIHSSVDGHLGCFHVLALVNSAVMKTGVHVFLPILVFLVCMPSSGIAGSYGSSISSFLRPTMFLKSEHNMKLKDAYSLEGGL